MITTILAVYTVAMLRNINDTDNIKLKFVKWVAYIVLEEHLDITPYTQSLRSKKAPSSSFIAM